MFFQHWKPLKHKKENLIKEFEAYCRESIVIWFNSASCDPNLIKPTPSQRLLDKIDYVIKKANKYLYIYYNKKIDVFGHSTFSGT